MSALPPIPEGFEPTRATLHAYAHGISVIPRALGVTHPKWWHISLKVDPRGFRTDNISIPGGGVARVLMDLLDHEAVVETSTGQRHSVSLNEGLTGTEFGDRLLTIMETLGVSAEYDRTQYEDDDAREYDALEGTQFFRAMAAVSQVFEEHAAMLDGWVGPVQLWPHGFDMAFEWFGTRSETYQENGEQVEYPSQINLGLYPGGRPYLYSNPWPFEADALIGHPLPQPARWHTEGWQGGELFYDEISHRDDADQLIRRFAKAVFDLASPTLLV
jgi:hypothetical protein